MKSEIDRYGHELEEHRKHQYSDDTSAGDEESEHSIIQRLALGICRDRDWTKVIISQNRPNIS